MFRAGAPRSVTRYLANVTPSTSRLSHIPTISRAQLNSSARALGVKRPTALAVAAHKPTATALIRYASTHPGNAFDHIDKKREEKIAKTEIEPEPDAVSIDSSVRHVFSGEGGEKGVEEGEKETDMLAGVKQDLVCTPKYHTFLCDSCL